MIEKKAIVALEEKSDSLDLYLFERQYQDFLSWWQENFHYFSTLSFNIENQTRQFINDVNQGLDFATAFLKIRSDLWGYYLEYIRQETILPFTNRFKNQRLVGDFYGDKSIIDLVDNREREGVVKEAMVDLEKRLKILQSGQFIVRASPKGWTNMGYEYTETQFQIFWREENDIVRGLTIRTASDLEAVREFFHQLGIEFLGTTEKELLKKITKTNLILTSTSLPEIVELISSSSGGLDHQGRFLADQYRRWEKNDGNYQRYDQLVSLLNFLEIKIKSLLEDKQLREEELNALLGFVLMTMAGKERDEKKTVDFQKVSDHFYPDGTYPLTDLSQWNRVFDYLQSLPGCAGGGTFSSFDNNLFQGSKGIFALTPFGTINIFLNEDKKKSVLQCVNCPFCHQIVDAEIVVKNGKKMIHCPNCKAKVNYESS